MIKGYLSQNLFFLDKRKHFATIEKLEIKVELKLRTEIVIVSNQI